MLPSCQTPTGITSPQEPKTLSLTRKPARALVVSARWLLTTTRKPPAKSVSGECADSGGRGIIQPESLEYERGEGSIL